MSSHEVKEKTVSFSFAEPGQNSDNSAAAEPKTTAATASKESNPVDDGQSPAAAAVRAQAPKSAIKNRIGPSDQPKFVVCDGCGQSIPIGEWPDHRDRLRDVPIEELTKKVGTFHRTFVQLIGKFIMWVMKNCYFREVTLVGEENIPRKGAVVFYGNHQNQFIDALMLNSSCGRQVRFIMAEKSFHHPIMGFFGRMFDSVPVVRPQDVPLIVGEGHLVRSDGITIYGEGTAFDKSLQPGDNLRWLSENKEKRSAQVSKIVSSTQIEMTVPVAPEHAIRKPTEYKTSRRIDHSEMYAQVYDTLQKEHCIGIFPEGGSHDHTSLLPLKAGVALFSLGAAERNIKVTVIPCGLTYFYGHKFRSRAYLEFGDAFSPPEDLVKMFTSDKRKATGIFLQQLQDALSAVTINVPDWRTLKFLHVFRQLYQPINRTISTGDYLRLMRRLSVVIKEQNDNPEFSDFRAKVENYSDYCSALMVRDSQAVTLKWLGTDEIAQIQLLLRRSFTLFMMAVVLVPFFVLGLPIGVIVRYYTNKKTKKALSESSVKIVGADVKGSFKILLSFVTVPVAFFMYTLLVFCFTNLHTATVFFFCLPMSMYVSLLILQEAVMELRAALPLFMSLFSQHKQFKKLYERREGLAKVAHDMVTRYDPQLAKEMEIYTAGHEEEDDLEIQPSLFSLRYNIRKRQAGNR